MRDDFFSVIGEILKYGGSTFAALVAMSIYTTTDGFFIGNWVGEEGLEAMALIYPITMIFAALGTLFETGGSAVVSEKIGEGKKQLAEKIMRANYVYAVILGAIFAIVGNIFIEPILNMLASSPEEYRVIDLAIGFLRISLCGVPFLLTIYLTGAFMRCVEKPTHVFYFVGTTSLANVILDALFVVLFGWGMQGAAFATLLAQMLGAAISIWYFRHSKQQFTSSFGLGNLKYLIQEFKIGAGFAVGAVMMSLIEYFLNIVLLSYDAVHLLAVLTISNIVLTFVFLPLNGLDTGIQPLISRLFGAKKEHSYLKVMRYGFFLTMILTFAIYIGLMVYTEEIARIFVNENELITPEMILFLRFTFVLQPFVGIYTWLSGIMAAMEDEWRNLVVSLTPLFVQVPLIWLMPKFLPIEYVALNYSINDVAEALIAFVLIRSFFKEKGLSFSKIFNLR